MFLYCSVELLYKICIKREVIPKTLQTFLSSSYLLSNLMFMLQEATVDDAHITAIDKLAARLEKRQTGDELATVRQRRRQLTDR